MANGTAWLTLFCIGLLACGPGDESNACEAFEQPLAAPGDAIDGDDYATFAAPFFEAYCTRCHSTRLATFEERNGAPDGYDWDDRASVEAHLAEIREAVSVTGFMPLTAPFPSCAERMRLARWIDADAP